MRVCVISGSPKGDNSITYQTVLYLQKKYPDVIFDTLHVGQKIRQYEKDMTEALVAIRSAEVLLFCYPVYTFIAPSQLHRFIELMKASGVDLSGKYAAQITTSKHFYDTTAHKYIEENCHDMGIKYVGGLSADMDDLLTESGRADVTTFWDMVTWKVSCDIYEPVPKRTVNPVAPYEKSIQPASKKSGNEAVIVANLAEGDTSLANMIADFQAAYPYESRVVNLVEYPFMGGCLGCFNCAVTGKCIYKDKFDEFLRQEIQSKTCIIYAFTISDHSMGSRMKMYDDRQFCNGHRTVTMGMPFGYIINGDYDNESNLQLIVEGRAQVGGNFLTKVATDKKGIIDLANTMEYALEHKVQQPAMFLGVGGMKIFRDLIYIMRGMMKADHEFYKAHGFYDFPQKQKGTILKMQLVGLIINNKKIQKKMGNKMTEGMLMPYKKVIEEA
ncbi:MAG: NAD(P)H-dependent oxidoreductase [Pseudobutyrivibrio sp.]|nr:NAD(P)H-dependent oxidoreductase [Pseudobutyrivibrio sp.]